MRTFELATLLGISVVPTKRIRSISQIDSYPCVLKTVDGHGGREVSLCTSAPEAANFFTQFNNRELIVQPFIESGARDVRLFMIGKEVVAAVKRTGNGSFKSNYTLSDSVENYVLSSWQKKEAITITRAIISDYVGIDFCCCQMVDGC